MNINKNIIKLNKLNKTIDFLSRIRVQEVQLPNTKNRENFLYE